MTDKTNKLYGGSTGIYEYGTDVELENFKNFFIFFNFLEVFTNRELFTFDTKGNRLCCIWVVWCMFSL